jgi:SAM-dependent methyltransferase
MTGEFKLEAAAPWGRNRAEYTAFFDLTGLPPHRRILDCAAGPSSFTAEASRLGHLVVAADPLYRLSKDEIKARIEESREVMVAGLRAAAHRFVWDTYGTPEDLEAARLSAMKHFLEDYEEGLAEGRYLEAALPDLPFEDEAFDLALSSHFLFLYSARVGLDFHLASVLELCRVAREVRIFPLLDLEGERSRHLLPVIDRLQGRGLATEIRKVGYEFQKGGNEMLLIRHAAPS